MATPAATSMPTDWNAIVATIIRPRALFGMNSATYAPLTGKSMPIPKPTTNWPISTVVGSAATALRAPPAAITSMSRR